MKPYNSRRDTRVVPDIEDLKDFILLWKAVDDGHAKSATAAAAHVKTQRTIKEPTKTIDLIRSYFGKKFIIESPYSVDASCRADVKLISDVIDQIDSLTDGANQYPDLRIGVGHSLSLSLGPEIISRFRPEHPSTAVRLVVDYSEHLRELLELGELHFVLTCVGLRGLKGDTSSFIEDSRVVSKGLTTAIIAPWSHRLSELYRLQGSPKTCTSSFLKSLFDQLLLESNSADKCIVHIFEGPLKEYNPAIADPRDLMKEIEVRFVSQTSYAIVNSLVSAGVDIGISIPELLTTEQRRSVQVIPLVVPEESEVSLVMLSIDKVNEKYVDNWDNVYDGKFKAPFERLKQVIKESVIATAGKTRPSFRIPVYLEWPVGNARSWVKGWFERAKSDERSFHGEFTIHEVWSAVRGCWINHLQEERCVLDGLVFQIETQHQIFEHIIARGYKQTGVRREDFSLSFVHRGQLGDAAQSVRVVGTWQGIDVGDNASYVAAAGHFVILSDDLSKQIANVTQLEDLVEEWRSASKLSRYDAKLS